ncbi:MAG: GNAT family N-acetyltransferase [Elusimicrobia bacterium]|nr:GNAT family N-acetyltransferase [Elusimicrobiota bacterium]
MIEIIAYRSEYQRDFKRLNLEWLDKYRLTESHGLQMLDEPQAAVIEKGGCIFLAMDGERVIGTAGLLKGPGEAYELSKMAVAPSHHGRGLGRMLLERCLEEAKRLKSKKIFLFSNLRLAAALKLYEKYGFRYVPVTGAPFATADVKMELSLPENCK